MTSHSLVYIIHYLYRVALRCAGIIDPIDTLRIGDRCCVGSFAVRLATNSLLRAYVNARTSLQFGTMNCTRFTQRSYVNSSDTIRSQVVVRRAFVCVTEAH